MDIIMGPCNNEGSKWSTMHYQRRQRRQRRGWRSNKQRRGCSARLDRALMILNEMDIERTEELDHLWLGTVWVRDIKDGYSSSCLGQQERDMVSIFVSGTGTRWLMSRIETNKRAGIEVRAWGGGDQVRLIPSAAPGGGPVKNTRWMFD